MVGAVCSPRTIFQAGEHYTCDTFTKVVTFNALSNHFIPIVSHNVSLVGVVNGESLTLTTYITYEMHSVNMCNIMSSSAFAVKVWLSVCEVN